MTVSMIEANVDGKTVSLALPKFGEKVSNGTVVEYFHQHDGGNGFLPYGQVLAALPWNEYHPFVVWDCAYSEHSGWHCERGFYAETISEAVKVYNQRIGRK